MKFVKRPNVNEIGVLTRHASGVRVFSHEFVRTGPFAEAADGLFVGAANRVFQCETPAQHERTQMGPKIKLVPPLRKPAEETVRFPVLANRRKIRKPARKIFRQVLCAFLLTPHDAPLPTLQLRLSSRPSAFLPHLRP